MSRAWAKCLEVAGCLRRTRHGRSSQSTCMRRVRSARARANGQEAWVSPLPPPVRTCDEQTYRQASTRRAGEVQYLGDMP